MLRELRIRDLAIIEDVTVEFGPGLNVLSGETGAGKSIILGALGLVLGGRGSAEVVRSGCDSAEVQALFDRTPPVEAALRALDLRLSDDEDGLLLRRIVTRAGRSRTYIGGNAAPVSSLKALAPLLVDYASQHEHQVLLDEGSHLGILDRFGGLQASADGVRDAVSALRETLRERDRLAAVEREQRAREEYLRFQLSELDSADLQPGEMEDLLTERARLRNAEDLAKTAGKAANALGGEKGAVERLLYVTQRLDDLRAIDPTLNACAESIEQALIAAQEAERELSSYARDARSDPRRLEDVEERFHLLRQLGRKHHRDAEQLVELRDELRTELDELDSLGERLASIEGVIAEARARAREASGALSIARAASATALAKEIEAELVTLAMPHARFGVQLHAVSLGSGAIGGGEGGGAPWLGSDGAEVAALQLAANPGEEPRPLSRVASGGELSRILLAIRRVLSTSSPVQTCVFDEVDSGLGGETADIVGAKLGEIAEAGQVLCITHLAQIAARASRHLQVRKEVLSGRTRTLADALDDEQRVSELVRMVAGGGLDEQAEAFARGLLMRARRSGARVH
jgi:DNA repair protein RecN (Recombination protein N)